MLVDVSYREFMSQKPMLGTGKLALIKGQEVCPLL